MMFFFDSIAENGRVPGNCTDEVPPPAQSADEFSSVMKFFLKTTVKLKI